jgi:Spy/CpxP family protein refolding chaperone
MNNITKNKWQVRLAALAVFLLGAAAGALAFNAYQSWAHASVREQRGGREHFERVFEQLQLTAEQKTQVQQIMSEARQQLRAVRKDSEPRLAEVRRQTDERLRQALTPEQWQKFQQLKDEMRGRRRGGGRGGDDSASPPGER